MPVNYEGMVGAISHLATTAPSCDAQNEISHSCTQLSNYFTHSQVCNFPSTQPSTDMLLFQTYMRTNMPCTPPSGTYSFILSLPSPTALAFATFASPGSVLLSAVPSGALLGLICLEGKGVKVGVGKRKGRFSTFYSPPLSTLSLHNATGGSTNHFCRCTQDTPNRLYATPSHMCNPNLELGCHS